MTNRAFARTSAAAGIFCLAMAAFFAPTGAKAGSDPPPDPLTQCQAAWNNGSARNSCRSESIDYESQKCRISATCKGWRVLGTLGQHYMNSNISPPAEGCVWYDSKTDGQLNLWHLFMCPTTVEFSPGNTDSVANCDGNLRRGSSC